MIPTSPAFTPHRSSGALSRSDFHHPHVTSLRETTSATESHACNHGQSFEKINCYPTFVRNDCCDSRNMCQLPPLSCTRPQSAPSNHIACTVPPNIPDGHFTSVFPASEYHIDPRSPALHDFALRAHAYHPQSYPNQLQGSATYLPVTAEEPISRLNTVMMFQAATGAPFASSSIFNSQVPYYPSIFQHSQDFANSPCDQGIVGQHEYATGSVVQNYFSVPPYNSTSAAPHGGSAGSIAMFPPSAVHATPPTDPVTSPASGVPSDTTYVCWCAGSGSPCRALLTGNMKELRGHLELEHQFRVTGKEYHGCLWAATKFYSERTSRVTLFLVTFE
ncbi:hypothetical protein BS17DRAFT_775045 [Gyrodon lividus]|nr:hypothetical protein BS17DRAFT_775045 [Gyrodon lividus]